MEIVLAVAAALLHGTAYSLYLTQVASGASVPNPASWSVWAFLSVINAFSFASASGSWLKGLQFFTGAVMCMAVFVYTLWVGHFAPLTTLGVVVLILSLCACLIWRLKSAEYASISLAVILLVSSIPTLLSVWSDASTEHGLPWTLWTIAFCLTLANVLRGWNEVKRQSAHPWMVTVVPIAGIVLHGTVAILAR